MPYKVQSSEKLRKSGADFETKAMLYLLNFREDSSQINYEVLSYGRHLTTSEIRLLVLQRIINSNPLERGVPTPFIEI